MKYEIIIQSWEGNFNSKKATLEKKVSEIPGSINKEKFLEMIKIYLFHEEYFDLWDKFIIKKVE